jgi:hypothetical protein
MLFLWVAQGARGHPCKRWGASHPTFEGRAPNHPGPHKYQSDNQIVPKDPAKESLELHISFPLL